MIKETLRVWRKNGIKPALKSAKKSLDSKKNAKRNLELYNVTHKLNANQEEIDLALRKLRENYVIFKSRMVKCHEQFDRITSLAIIENNEPALLYTDEFANGSFIFKPDFSPETLEAYNYMGNCIVVKRDCLDNKREYQSLEIVEPDAIEDIARHAAKHGEAVCHIPKALFVDYQGNTTLCNKKEKEDEFGELPKLSIIIPNCDHVSDLKRLIDSILNIEKYHEYEIIVVENNSKNKETFEYYEKLRTGVYNSFGCKKIKIIKWEGTFNYSAINNFAVKQAEGELILLLNNDTQFIEPLSLRYMAGYAKRENIGAVGACLLYGNDTIQHAGVVVGIGPDKTAVHLNAGEPFDSEECREVIHHNRNYSAVTGACLMVKKSEYEKVGGLDENFAVAYNDIDFCLRLIENGLRNVYVSDALLYHFESKSRGSDKKGEKYQRFMREAELFRNKWSRYIKQGDPYYNVNMKKGMIVLQIYKVNKLATYLKHYGVKGMFHKAFSKLYDTDDYENRWETLVPADEELEKQRKEDFSGSPSVSVLVPVYNPEKTHFSAMLLSVLHQTYPNWELCLVDAGDEKMEEVVDELAGNDSRVRYIKTDNMGISGNTNIALDMARGEYIALLDNDDTLAEDALYRMIKEITKSGADCAYSDEDKMDSEGNRHFCPHIKPDFDEVLLRTNNYICHLFMVKTSIAREVGGFSPETDGAQDFDFIIKCTRVAAKVVHVPHILYHWREHEGSTSGNPLSKMYAYEAGCRAISAFLDSEGRCGKVSMLKDMGYYRVDYELPKELPHVRIVVLGVKDKDYAKTYFSYLRKTTEYENFSICAMWDADAARLSGVSCDAFLVIMAGTMIEDPKWLSKLVADMAQEKMDVVAAKTTINEPYLGMKSINKSFLAFAGREYTDAFGVVHENAGKPAWYKGCFNRTLIACRIEKSPKTGILVKKETYIAMLNEKNYSLAGADMMYEPDVIFARF